MDALTSVFNVFTAVGEWLADAFQTVSSLFYVPETGLTLFGVMTVVGLGFSVLFLIINKIKDFLRFR